MRVIIVGAGLGGLCLARGLRKSDIDVEVYERDATLAARSQGYRIHIDGRGAQALYDRLPSDLFELFTATTGQAGRQLTAMTKSLRPLHTQPFTNPSPNPSPGAVNTSVDRSVLRTVLYCGLAETVRFGREFVHFREPPNQAAGRPRPQHDIDFGDAASFAMWALAGKAAAFPAPDKEMRSLDPAGLYAAAQRMVRGWHPSLRVLVDAATVEDLFFLAVRTSVPIEPWRPTPVTLLGDAIHAMPPSRGSAANTTSPSPGRIGTLLGRLRNH